MALKTFLLAIIAILSNSLPIKDSCNLTPDLKKDVCEFSNGLFDCCKSEDNNFACDAFKKLNNETQNVVCGLDVLMLNECCD